MLTLSNTLSFLRGPLAFLLLIDRPIVRIGAIALAMLSDIFDGFLARHYNQPTRFGAILDPAMDKFFVIFGLVLFGYEGRLSLVNALFMLSRDAALILFAIYLLLTKRWHTFIFRSIKWGKIATILQFIALLLLTLGFPFPTVLRPLFVIIGCFVLAELFFIQYRERKQESS